MSCLRSALLCLLVFSSLAPLLALDQIVVFPSANANQISVLRADDLSLAGAFPSPANAFKVLQSNDGLRYYVITRRAENTVVVVDAETLQVLNQIDLNASPSSVEITPDGRYILAAAGDLKVVDLVTETVAASLPVGGGPTRVIVNDSSTRAYVLASAGAAISVIDLESFAVLDTIDAPNASDIALTIGGARLLAAFRDGVRQYRTTDRTELNTIETNYSLVNPRIVVLPNSLRIVIESSGVAPNNTAQFVDLDSRVVRDVGDVGSELIEITPITVDRAYGILVNSNDLVSIDFAADSDPVLAFPPFGENARALGLSPDGSQLYVSSLLDSTMLRVNTGSDSVEAAVTLPVPPAGHEVLFGPSPLPPATITILGGDGQFFPPNTTLPVLLSVLVTDRNGRPLSGVPVIFADSAGFGLQFSDTSTETNTRGVASVEVFIPPAPQEPVAALAARPSEPVFLAPGESVSVGGAQSTDDPIESAIVTASAAGVEPVSFTVNIVRGVGLIKISGDFQVTTENTPFPKSILVLATDDTGRPLPPGTTIEVASFGGRCNTSGVEVDQVGFAEIRCIGEPFSSANDLLFLQGVVSLSIPEFRAVLGGDLTTASFFFSLASSSIQLELLKVSGDNQTGDTGSELAQPLRFRMNSSFGFLPQLPINVDIRNVSGPGVIFDPRRALAQFAQVGEVNVTLGANAGSTVLQLEASTPGLPTIAFTINAEGGQPERIEKEGDGQVGKITTTLPMPLRVRVVNESGDFVPNPEVTWRVLQGDATLETSTDAQGSSAVVTFGAMPGQVRVLAAIGTLQETFTLTSVPPEPASISTFSGQNQTLTSGVLSEPLVVRVNEIDNAPASGAVVTFSGPPTVRFQPPVGAPPGNPVQVATDSQGLASVQAELVASAALTAEGGSRDQLAQTLTINASVGPSLQTSFLLNVVGRTPAFESAGIVNAARNDLRGVVPGSIATIFGTGLMEGIIGIEEPRGATSYQGTVVRIGGVPAPLLAFANVEGQEQINLQVPFEVRPGQTTTVEIENNGSRSAVANIAVFSAQPGIFEIPLAAGGSVGAVVHADTGTLVTPDTPALRGEAVSLFFTGGGSINPPVGTGALGPSPPSLSSLPTVVGVDNRGAPVLFSGYAPGFLGLYQINFTIPEDSTCGLRPLNVRMGDSFSPNSMIAVRCP